MPDFLFRPQLLRCASGIWQLVKEVSKSIFSGWLWITGVVTDQTHSAHASAINWGWAKLHLHSQVVWSVSKVWAGVNPGHFSKADVSRQSKPPAPKLGLRPVPSPKQQSYKISYISTAVQVKKRLLEANYSLILQHLWGNWFDLHPKIQFSFVPFLPPYDKLFKVYIPT